MHTTFMLVLALLLISCNRSDPADGSSSTPAGNMTMITHPLQIERVDVLVAESYPPQLSAQVTGIIPDSCTSPLEPQVVHDGSTFTVTILGQRPADLACAQIISPYQQTVPLGAVQPGNYRVVVNGVSRDVMVN